MTLQELRAAIDATDEQVLELLAQRGRLVREIWKLKQQEGMERLDVARETAVLVRLSARGASLGLNPADVEHIWREILRVRAG